MIGISILAALVLVATVPEIPWQLIAYGRRTALMMFSDREDSNTYPISVLYRGEGLNSSIVITDQAGLRIIYVNGNVEASNAADDMRLERMAGHIPALFHAGTRDVFIVGFGAGITAGSFVTYPEVKSITIAELESLIPPASARFFRNENENVLNDARTRVVYDDGRHYLLTHNQIFDVITSDPVHLWVKGTSALYSREYFELVRHHLKPGGVIAQWLPLYDGDVDAIKSVLATFFEVFPNGTVWSNHIGNSGYDLVLLGQIGPTKINVEELQVRLDRPDYSAVRGSLRAVGFQSASDILATYLGQAADLKPWLAGAQINLDSNLRLQYLAGLEMNSRASERNYHALSVYRRFPEALFTGSESAIQPLRTLLRPFN
jgi:spermidine synthase